MPSSGMRFSTNIPGGDRAPTRSRKLGSGSKMDFGATAGSPPGAWYASSTRSSNETAPVQGSAGTMPAWSASFRSVIDVVPTLAADVERDVVHVVFHFPYGDGLLATQLPGQITD